MGKAAAVVSLMALSNSAFAADCVAAADGSFLPGNTIPSCNKVVAATTTQSGGAGHYILTRSHLHETLTVGDTVVTANVTGGYGGIGNQYATGASGAAINTGNLTFSVKANGNVGGLSTHSNVNMTTKNVILNLTDNYTAGSNSSGDVAQYGVLTGSTVDSGERATYNGQYSTITTENLTINQTATGGKVNPILNNGIRAIQGAYQNLGNGSAGQVIVNGNLDMTLTGNRSIGIYVSGNQSNHGDATAAGANGSLTPKVILNGDANITINKGTDTSSIAWDSHGIKLGKIRYAGEGAGILESHGKLTIDTTKALQGGGIKMMRNSIFDASDANASTEIKTNGYALEIGGHDDGSRSTGTFEQAASNGVTASFNNAVFTTNGTSIDPLITATGTRRDLIFVDQGQVDTKLNFTGANTNLTANANGYILNVSGNYTAPNYSYYSNTYDASGVELQGQNLFQGSSVTFNASDAGSMTGLVYKGLVKNTQTLDSSKTPTLNLNLSNGFTWNLNANASAPNGDKTTALFDTATISNGAVINGAFDDAGNNNYILSGNVVSNGGVINLDNATHAKYNDVLTINGNYSGSNGASVRMNTLWNAPGDVAITVAEGGADSESDVLHIIGTADGQTSVNPIAADGTVNVIDGSVQQIASIINTVPVVVVDGANAAGTFVGTAQTTGATEVQLTSRDAANGGREYYWTMSAKIAPVDPVDPVEPVKPQPPVIPIYTPTVPAYVQMPVVDMELGYTTLGTLHERRGENQTLAWDECGTCGSDAKGQTWGRIFGKHLEQNGKTRLNMDTDMYGFQFGHDFKIKRTDEGGHRLTGAYLAYGHANTDFSDSYRAENGIVSADKYTGNGKTNAVSLGVTHTRYAPNGSYLDLVGQLSYLRNKYNSRDGYQASQNGWGAALSAEVGRPYAISKHTAGEAGWLLEPQAQLIYQYVDLNDFNDGVRQVNEKGQHGLRGRVGVRLAHNAQASEKNYQTKTFYAVANVWHDFINSKSVGIGRDNLSEKYASTWGEVGVGVQFPVGKHSYLYADARYERDLGSSKREGYRGTIGFKHTWK
jgi:outer membrane autotransporter protein